MTIRGTILLIGLPLFLLLAGLNGGLLWLQEKTEQRQAQESQAIAAAVTVAEFVSADGLALPPSSPRRVAELRRAAGLVPGLKSLYVMSRGKVVLSLKGPGDEIVSLPSPPRSARILDAKRGAAGQRMLSAVAPASGGAYVVATVTARPASPAMSLGPFILSMFAAASLIGLLVSILFARMVTRELGVANRLIEEVKSGKMPERGARLRIREIRELADAVELMATNLAAALGRMQRRRGRKPDLVMSVSAYRDETMSPVVTERACVSLAVRHIGNAPAGSFFVLAERDGDAALLLGRCGGNDAADALANALRAQRFFAQAIFERSLEDNVALSRRGHLLEDFQSRLWSSSQPPLGLETLTLSDDQAGTIVAGYAAKLPMLTPGELVEDLALLLSADHHGIIAVLKPAGMAVEGLAAEAAGQIA